MIPLILSLVSAALFLSLSMWVYGADVLVTSAWVALVFWGQICAGLAVYGLSRKQVADAMK